MLVHEIKKQILVQEAIECVYKHITTTIVHAPCVRLPLLSFFFFVKTRTKGEIETFGPCLQQQFMITKAYKLEVVAEGNSSLVSTRRS